MADAVIFMFAVCTITTVGLFCLLRSEMLAQFAYQRGQISRLNEIERELNHLATASPDADDARLPGTPKTQARSARTLTKEEVSGLLGAASHEPVQAQGMVETCRYPKMLIPVFLVLFLSSPTMAQCPAYQYRPYRPVPVYRQPQPAYFQPVAVRPTQPVQQAGNSQAQFMASLNAWRAQNGRGPVGWDQNLAAWASRGNQAHSVMAPGAGQVWAGTYDFASALAMWQTSPGHIRVLLGARSAVGISACSTGITCNAR